VPEGRHEATVILRTYNSCLTYKPHLCLVFVQNLMARPTKHPEFVHSWHEVYFIRGKCHVATDRPTDRPTAVSTENARWRAAVNTAKPVRKKQASVVVGWTTSGGPRRTDHQDGTTLPISILHICHMSAQWSPPDTTVSENPVSYSRTAYIPSGRCLLTSYS
jgi:hypothetical protein